MGELLSKQKRTKFSAVQFPKVKIKKDYGTFRVKSKTVKQNETEKITIFPFKLKSLCPLNALKKYKKELVANKIDFSQGPFFRLNENVPLTKRFLNNYLKEKFPGKNLSGHSFRSGIPSTIANFPE